MRHAQCVAPTETKGADARTTAALVQDDGRHWEKELHCQQHESLMVCIRRGARARDGRANGLRTRAVRDAGVVIAAIARLALLERPVGDAYCHKLDEEAG